MKKLELKHLAPYLPYGLKFHGASNGFAEHFYPIMSIVSTENEETSIDIILKEQFKPILRPLADLTKEIEVNGKKFVPYIELLRESNFDVDNMSIEDIEYYKPDETEFDCIILKSYYEMVKLFEWHFDVFGLIEKKLAIDINKL